MEEEPGQEVKGSNSVEEHGSKFVSKSYKPRNHLSPARGNTSLAKE